MNLYTTPRLFLLFVFTAIFYFSQAQTKSNDWWQHTSVYQIYPRSYYDSNNDGIGDIQGIIQKLDYIKELGFETVWISPFFSSPQKDFGYDISNYYTIAPEYGDTTTANQLIDEVHKRGMKIIFDLVMNHTSNEHEWFKNSSSSTQSEKSDWYIWQNGKGRKGKRKPNNWKSMVGGSGWHYNEQRKQFYWASFLDFQPDLNYHNPQVKQAMLNMVQYWLNKGVDGFRLDIFNAVYEDTAFTNNPFGLKAIPDETNPNGFFQKAKYTINNPHSFEFATELRNTVDKYDNRYLVGEVFGDAAILKQYCNYKGKQGLNSVFLFQTLNTSFKAKSYQRLITDFEKNFPAPYLPTYVFSNHDRKRSISRLKNNTDKAKLLALFQYTVRGIPFTYYGEELGVPQQNIPLKQGKDPIAQRLKWLPQFIANVSTEAINRDGCRTPMLWNNTTNAGFTSSTPWLPVTKNYEQLSVETQTNDTTSLLHFYKQLLALRSATPALRSGTMEIAKEYCNNQMLAYYRISGNYKYFIILNMSKHTVKPQLPKGKIVFTLNASANGVLNAFGGVIIAVSS